ncbi:unnamed protein product [Phytophthora fragariaefolia]|uniref:Unnamed protein product n=1 Tax=Phytophthora fragariaefolia TaxID=1490495 RepID=A0A9W6TXF7_9STRA|nr:unnamed protein product [Phytophthora fragariaefolia]
MESAGAVAPHESEHRPVCTCDAAAPAVLVSKTNQDAFGVAQLYPRWSMKEAMTVASFVEDTLQHLRRVINVTGVATQTPEPGISLADRARMVYVKLKKGEKSESAVVSDCEKYNVVRAELMPLVDALQQLPSQKFYETFADLRSTVETFKTKWYLDPYDEQMDDVTGDGLDMHDFQQAQRIEVSEVAQLYKNEGAIASSGVYTQADTIEPLPVTHEDTELDLCCLTNPSQVSPPGLDLCEKSQEVLLSSTDPASGATQRTISDDSASAPGPGGITRLHVLKLPIPLTARAKSSTKGKWSVEETTSNCPIQLSYFYKWMINTADQDKVGAIATQYRVCHDKAYMLSRSPIALRRPGTSVINDANFVIPKKLVERVNSALIRYARERDKANEYGLVGSDPDDDVAAAYVVSEMGGFSVNYVRLLLDYYCVMSVVDEFRKDIGRIERDWSKCGALKHPFLEKVTASPSVLAKVVAQLYRNSPLSRALVMPSRRAGRCEGATFGAIVGRLARHKMLNDVVMDAALCHVSNYDTSCYVIDADSVTDEKIIVPDFPLSSCKFMLVPVHMKALKHWMIQIEEIKVSEHDISKDKIWVTLNDPL